MRLPSSFSTVSPLPARGGEAERRPAEAERQDPLSVGSGIEQQVLAGDATSRRPEPT